MPAPVPPSLFDPVEIGAITAPNRIFMAPLTRGRADADAVPTPVMGTYYAQRAEAGLIFSEATGISREGLGWPYAPGLWTDAQVEGWKPVLDRLHAAGGRIHAQLWHMGRVVHPDFNDGKVPVSASATTAPGHAWTFTGRQDYVAARALGRDEIARIVDDYGVAAENAKRAGFDGVMLHGANGYLIDQFLKSSTNERDDDYGGSVQNRIRLLDEVTRRLIEVWGADRVGVRLSPNGDTQGAIDDDPETTFTAAAARLQELGIAYLELREPGPFGTFGRTGVAGVSPAIRKVFTGPLILNSDYGRESAEAMLEAGRCDAISFGRTFLANPDLVERFRRKAGLNADDPATWYIPGDKGYIDYPALDAAAVTGG